MSHRRHPVPSIPGYKLPGESPCCKNCVSKEFYPGGNVCTQGKSVCTLDPEKEHQVAERGWCPAFQERGSK